MIEISQDFRLGCVAFRPAPLGEELIVKAVAVIKAFDIAAGARIAIPMPGPADAGRTLDSLNGESTFAQAIHRVEAGKTRTYDDHVDAQAVAGWLLRHGTPRSVMRTRA